MTILTLRSPLRAVEAAGAANKGNAAGWIRLRRRTLARWVARSRQRHALREIAEANDLHLLKDIGVSREEAFREADKPFWRR
jgi:uncharacterized protein YjiS (DUF1127 family)